MSASNSSEPFRDVFEKTRSIKEAAIAFFERNRALSNQDLLNVSRQLKADLLFNAGAWHYPVPAGFTPCLSQEVEQEIISAYEQTATPNASESDAMSKLWKEHKFGRSLPQVMVGDQVVSEIGNAWPEMKARPRPSTTSGSSEPFRIEFEKTHSIEAAAMAFFRHHVTLPSIELTQVAHQLKEDLLTHSGPWLVAKGAGAAPSLTLDATFAITQAYGYTAGGAARQYAELAQIFTDRNAPAMGRTLGQAAAVGHPVDRGQPRPAPRPGR